MIDPEAEDRPNEYYGIRESKVASLAKGSDYSSESVYKYLDRMMRPKTLDVVVPWEWGQMKAEGVILPATEGRSSYISLSDADKGKEITLSWENVKTERTFVFHEDNLSQKAYAFRLENALDSQPVEISYKNGKDQSVKKSVTPYNGYAIIYEPSGIKGEVWMSQNYAGSYRYALVAYPRGISSQYGLSPLIVSSIASNYRYNYQTLSSNAVIMCANPVAKFQRVGFDVPTVVRYCAMDNDGKIIAGTNGEVTPQAGSGNFELPFKALYENQNSHLMVEYEYLAGKETRTQLEYYYLDTLEENLRYGKANSYAIVVSSYIQRLSVIGVDGKVQNFPAQSNVFITINPGDIIELQLATASLAIQRAELKLLNHRRTVDANGDVSGWIFDYTKSSLAVSIEETDFSAFTPNKYTTLRFLPTREQMTPGRISQIRVVTVFHDGTSDVNNVCWGKMADEETAANIAKITDILNKQDFFHDDQMVFRVGDLKVKDNTRNVTYDNARFTFNEEVAKEIDKIKINLATPSKNPFTYEVKREGDEYIIRGYANAEKMNKAGMVQLADRWSDATFDELFDETKRYVIQARSKYNPNFPGIKGYMEGKAVITPSGDIQFSFHEGRTYVESDFFHLPEKLFNLSYYCSWTAAFEGAITSIFEIKAPDNGGDPTAVFNFNLVESSSVYMNTRTAHNGLSIDIGVYAVKVSLEGEIEDANYHRQSIHRPYAADTLKMQWEARFSTGGDLYERNYNRIITGPSDVDIEEGNMKKWYSWFKKPGEKPFYRTHLIKAASPGWGTSKASSFGVMSDSASAGVYHQDNMLMVAAADVFSLAARGGDSYRLDADKLSAVRYYNGGQGIVYMDSNSNIVTSDIDGSATGTLDTKAFGLDIVSAENGNTIASWGSYKDLDIDALDNIGKDGILKYASGKTEIKVGIFNGTNWDITTLTDNEMADITPKTAVNGTNGVVVWTQGILNDYHLEDGLPVIAFSESRLMFAQYNGSAWGKPAVLYTPSGESIADYSVAMADDGSALVTAVMGSGKITIVRISKGGEVTVINNSLPTTTKASLVYNGKNYLLACSSDRKDGEDEDNGRIVLALYEINTDGFVTNSTFSGIPTDISGDFNLFRNWSESGAAVLVWRGSSKDKSEARNTIYASKVSEANGDNTVLISAPIPAANINLPTSTGPDGEGGAFTVSYDAYSKGNDLEILTVFGESTSGEPDGGVYLAETQAQFKNTIEITSVVNDIPDLMPGLCTNFNIQVKNTGFVPITDITAEIGGESVTKTMNVLPNGETTVTAAFTPMGNLPDRIDYSVTAVFDDKSETTITDSISLLQTDIAAKILSFMQESGNYNIKALISNNTPFSLSDKTVVAGIYEDSFGTIPITEEKFAGSKFESETLGTSVFVDIAFTGTKDLPQSLYLVAKAYDSSGEEIPDNNSMNNILTITNIVPASVTDPGDSNGGDSSGGGSSGGGSITPPPPITPIVTEKQPDMPTTAKMSVSGTVKDGSFEVNITGQMAKDAIKASLDAAKKSGKEVDGIAVEFSVTGGGSYTSLNATIDAVAIDCLREAGVIFIKIGSAVLDVTLDTAAIAEIDRQSSGMVTVSTRAQTKLSKAAKALIGSRPVFDITIGYQKNGETEYVSNFGKGAVTLGIAYKATDKEKTGSLFGVYVDKNGKPQLLNNSSYAGGRLIFSRNSLSTYGVGYKTPAPAFTDTTKHWAKDNIDFVVSRYLISGTSTTTFAPDTTITRATFLMALGKLSGADVSGYKASSFIDVKVTDPAMPYIEWAVKAKIVQGIGNGKFGPALSISRQDMAVMMQNYAKATGYKIPVSVAAVTFSDNAKISAYAKEAVRTMQQAGIMQGKGNNTFDPQGNATRGEASTILRRFVELVIDEGTARGWSQNDAEQWQYIGENGKAVTGWMDIDSKRYYFTMDGLMVSGKWLEIGGKWYYFNADGSLAKNTKIDGYEIDENGVRTTK